MAYHHCQWGPFPWNSSKARHMDRLAPRRRARPNEAFLKTPGVSATGRAGGGRACGGGAPGVLRCDLVRGPFGWAGEIRSVLRSFVHRRVQSYLHWLHAATASLLADGHGKRIFAKRSRVE